jgi:hypothetical protein
LDVGCAQRIIDGQIQVKSKVEICSFDKNGVMFSDGTRADAEIVVFAWVSVRFDEILLNEAQFIAPVFNQWQKL